MREGGANIHQKQWNRHPNCGTPHNHSVNAAEPAVKAIKYHVIAGLATVDINCPLQFWDIFPAQMQDTLNLLRTSRRDPSKSAYEEMEGEFDFNRTPISILGTKALAFVDPDERASWEAHGVDCYVIGRCLDHYRLLQFFVTHTKGVHRTGTHRLYPTNCKVPSLSEADHTLLVALQFLQLIKQNTPPDAADKLTHAGHIKALQSIITETTPPRVETTQPPRVSSSTVPNPISAPTSNDPTAPRMIRATKQVQQRRTRSNTMPIVMKEEAEPPIIMPSSNDHFSKRQVNGKLIGSKRNHARHASRKSIQTIINAQTVKDKSMDIRKGINQIIDEGSKNYNNNSPPPAATSLITFQNVNPKGYNSPPPSITTIT